MVETIKNVFDGFVGYGYYDGYDFIFHNENGPAITYTHQNEHGYEYWRHGRPHREDGPAHFLYTGTQYYYYYYINGKQVTDKVNEWFDERNIDSENMTTDDKLALTFFMRSLI